MEPTAEKTEALVLGVIKYGDHGHVVRTFTPTHGLCAFMVHSLRSKKAGQFRPSMTMPLTAIEVVIDPRAKGSLRRFSEVRPLHHWQSLNMDPVKMTLCTFGAEVISKVITEEHPDEAFFSSVLNWLIGLDNDEIPLSTAPQELLLIAAHHLGCYPHMETYQEGFVFDQMDGTFVAIAPDHSYWMTAQESSALVSLVQKSGRVDKVMRQKLLEELLSYVRIHHEPFGKLKSLEIIRTLLS